MRLRPDPIAELEEKGREIRDPVEKLRFLRRSLERYERVDQKLQAVPGAPLGRYYLGTGVGHRVWAGRSAMLAPVSRMHATLSSPISTGRQGEPMNMDELIRALLSFFPKPAHLATFHRESALFARQCSRGSQAL